MKNKYLSKNILISGAGVAGLTLAYWLKRYGFNPTIVERSPVVPRGGYKIDIRGVALEILKQMQAYSSVFDSRTSIQKALFVDKSGKHLTEMSGDLCGVRSEEDLEIMRGDLCQILWNQSADVECLFGDSITQISQNQQGVYVEFDINKPRLFDLVVGADGLHSTVRKLVFGEESLFLKNLGVYLSVFTIPNFLNLDRSEIEYFEPQKFVNVYSARSDLNAKAGFVFFSTPLSFDPRNVEQQQQLLKNAFANVGWETQRLLAAMEDSKDFYFDAAAQIHMSHWSFDRTVLIGDAGYAASPLSGQGTSVAMVGAYVLAGELAESQGDHIRAFSRYEELLRKFVKKNQKLAQMSVKLMSSTDSSWVAWVHHGFMRLFPQRWIHFFKKWALKHVSKAAHAIRLKNYSNFE